MEFDKSKVYTSVNADELKVGSKVICADSMGQLKAKVHEGEEIETLTNVAGDFCLYRFETNDAAYILAYLVEKPEEKKLKWTDLKMGDIVSNQTETRMVIGINTSGLVNIDDGCISHVNLGGTWADDEDLAEWEKVEK